MAIPAETLAALDAFASSLDTSIQDSTKTIPDYVAYYYFAQFLRGEIGGGSSGSTGGTLTALDSTSDSYTQVATNYIYWTVPTGEKWTVRSVYVALASHSTSGTRAIAVGHTNDDASPKTFVVSLSQVTQAASLTYTYSFAIGQPDSSALRTGNIIPCTLAYMQIPAGDRLVVIEQAGVTANDVIAARAIVEVETV